MTDSAHRGRICQLVRGAGVAAITLAACAFGGAAMAQDQAAGADGAAQSASAWLKVCNKVPVRGEDGKKDLCITLFERLNTFNGGIQVSTAIRKLEGKDNEEFVVTVPLAMDLPQGIVLIFGDSKEDRMRLPYSYCDPTGCHSLVGATPELIDRLKKGDKMGVAVRDAFGRTTTFPVPLKGFTKTYDGGPIETEKYLTLRKNLVNLIEKRRRDTVAASREQAKKDADKRAADTTAE